MPINILYVFDDKYAPFAGISMLSLFENNKECNFRVFCAGMNIDGDNVAKIEKQAQLYGIKVEWIDTDKAIERINSMPTGEWNGSKANMLKLFVLPEIPEDVDRLLYLDCDTIIMGGIDTINDISIDGQAVAMAYDCIAQDTAKLIGNEHYYNSGVLNYNMNYWRNPEIIENMMEHLKDNIASYPDNDQRFLNIFCRDDIATLPQKYNTQGPLFAYGARTYTNTYKNQSYYSVEEIEEAISNPVVYHFFRFLGSYPWENSSIHPLMPLFNEWKAKSLWKDMPAVNSDLGIVFKVERILYKIMPKRMFLAVFNGIRKIKKF